MEKLSFTRNKFGIEVVKCCGSCAHKCFKDGNHPRWCKEKDEKVETYGVCDKWQMSEALNRVGGTECQVKRSLYLKYVYKVRMKEQVAIENGTMKATDQLSVDELREKFESDYGISPFIGE